QPQNEAIRLQVMAAVYTALSRWEPRITLSTVSITRDFDGSMVVELTGQRNDGSPLAMSVSTGGNSGSY
ncbi:baseplate assembly protein, partial [Erwinia mallotivora]